MTAESRPSSGELLVFDQLNDMLANKYEQVVETLDREIAVTREDGGVAAEAFIDPELLLSAEGNPDTATMWAQVITNGHATADSVRTTICSIHFAYRATQEIFDRPFGLHADELIEGCEEVADYYQRLRQHIPHFIRQNPTLALLIDEYTVHLDPSRDYEDVVQMSAGIIFMAAHAAERELAIVAATEKLIAEIV